MLRIIVGYLKNPRKGKNTIESMTPISGEAATINTSATAKMTRTIVNGEIKNVNVPTKSPKRNIKLPLPRSLFEPSSNDSSEKPNAPWKTIFPKTLILTALAKDILEKHIGNAVTSITIPIII